MGSYELNGDIDLADVVMTQLGKILQSYQSPQVSEAQLEFKITILIRPSYLNEINCGMGFSGSKVIKMEDLKLDLLKKSHNKDMMNQGLGKFLQNTDRQFFEFCNTAEDFNPEGNFVQFVLQLRRKCDSRFHLGCLGKEM